MKPEAQARQQIDTLLTQAGWVVQEVDRFNLGAIQQRCLWPEQKFYELLSRRLINR